MKLLSGIVVFLLVGCASAPLIVDKSGWVAFGHPLLVPRLNETSGLNAINCGHYDLLNADDREKMKKIAPACIKNAMRTDQPFKFGVIDIVQDLYMHDVVISDPDSKFWLISYGVMIDNSDHHTKVLKCDLIEVEFNPFFFSREACVVVDSQKWFDGKH